MIIGSNVRHYAKVSSTNTVASVMIREEKPPEGTVITASFQEGGRGQAGNTWESEPDNNLLMSVILYPVMIKPAQQFVISQMVSLAVHDLVKTHTPLVRIKWPNDIFVADDKIAGILIENSIMGEKLGSCVAGIGLNVNQILFSAGVGNPVSLARITGKTFDLAQVAGQLMEILDRRYTMLLQGKASLLGKEYHAALYRSDGWHRFADGQGEFEGKIERVSSDGMLLVRKKNGIISEYAFKEIDYIL